MNQFKCHLFLLLILLSGTINAFSQTISKADYRRAVGFLNENIRDKVYHLEVRPNWNKDSISFWYQTRMPEGKVFYSVNLNTLKKRDAFNHEKLARALNLFFNDTIYKAFDLPFNFLTFLHRDTIKLDAHDKTLSISLTDYTISEIQNGTEHKPNEFISPDKKWIAIIKDYNIYLKHVDEGKEIQLSTDGERLFEYGNYYGWADVIRGEEGTRKDNFIVEWSPDSKKIKTVISDLRNADKMFLLDWSVDSLYRPDLLYYYRASPGDTNLVYEMPVIIDIDKRNVIKPDIPPSPHFLSSYYTWSKDGKKLFGRYAHRGFKRFDFLEIDAETGKKRILFSDSSDTNVETYGPLKVSETLRKVFFTSERSGWNQLYSFDFDGGDIIALTNGSFYINNILHLDEQNSWIYFSAVGKEIGRNPYLIHVYKISTNGTSLTLLTPEYANHNAYFDPTGKYFIDNYSALDVPTESVIRRTSDGKIVAEPGQCDITELHKINWPFPEPFEVIARDGKTKLYGALWKPSSFDASKSYPIIDHSYTGPHYSIFPKSFYATIRNSGRQALAELGFVVMVVDGMGTAQRSKAFHNMSYKNLGEGLTDHVLAISQLGKKHVWIDTTRVGIYGHSAGGYDAAHAMLRFPDFYKVAVASSADHDHRMEKAWWPEMYMGWPVDSAYHLQSNITMAGNLKGNLLITHGGIDENVNPSATFKLAEALIKADKDFDMLILPSQRHGYYGKYNHYFTKRKWNYFVQNLLKTEPVWDFEFE